MSIIKLHVFDPAFAVTAAEEAAIMKAAAELMFPQTLTEWISQEQKFERDMIGSGVSASLSGLCQSACEKVGVHAAKKTFVIYA